MDSVSKKGLLVLAPRHLKEVLVPLDFPKVGDDVIGNRLLPLMTIIVGKILLRVLCTLLWMEKNYIPSVGRTLSGRPEFDRTVVTQTPSNSETSIEFSSIWLVG